MAVDQLLDQLVTQTIDLNRTPALLIEGLNSTWSCISAMLATLSAAELRETFEHRFPEGPAVLKIERKSNETSILLVVKNPGAAAQAGIAPKPGQAKVLFGNILPGESTLTFNKKLIKVKAGAGTKAPDGPTLDLKPGKYKYSIKPAGKAAMTEEIEVGGDETWGLMIGPGGILALQAY